MRTVYGELSTRIVNAALPVQRRVYRDGAFPDNITFPYAGIAEPSPSEKQPGTGYVLRTFAISVYQIRGRTKNTQLPRQVAMLFDRQRWAYFLDDAQTQQRQVITRVLSVEEVDRPEDGENYDTVTVTVRCWPDQP